MKKMVFIACALMVIAAGSAMAGSDLSWNDCVAGGGVADRATACANSGVGNLFVSFVSPTDLPQMAASDCFTDIEASQTINNWWLPAAGLATRWGHLAPSVVSGACPGWFDAAPNGASAFPPSAVQLSSSRMRLRTIIVIGAGEEQPVTAGTEYVTSQIQLKFNAGSATNVECNQGGAIGVVNLTLQQPGQPNTVMESPDVRSCVTFRGGGGKVCPGATPTKKATWGSIKALYR
jgi:hypothetical protein